MLRAPSLAFVLALAGSAVGQVFVHSPANLPGGPANNDPTSRVAFGDVDLDGDLDTVVATGSESALFQNRLWLNQGGLQGGVEGVFADATSTRFPSVVTETRDVNLGDLDGDGDLDLHCANASNVSQQPSRFWINQGGAQGGSAGFFADETAARWTNLAAPSSSIASGQLLAGGGYISWAQEQDLADLDGDGDLDLVAASAAGNFNPANEPTRLFLNDGAGFFSEFNPSGFKLSGLSIANGDPGLWCEGLQQSHTSNTTGQFCDIAGGVWEVGVSDFDGDLDLDFVQKRFANVRAFRNRSETGSMLWRDFTWVLFGSKGNGDSLELELGDLDRDGDTDILGIDWIGGYDVTFRNAGLHLAVFGEPQWIPSSFAAVGSGELLDYDADGYLDLFLAGFGHADSLWRHIGLPETMQYYEIANAVIQGPLGESWDAVTGDVDGDGDEDVLEAHDGADQLLLNVVGPPDTRAAAIPLVDHPADFNALGQPVRIRAHVLDNAAELVTANNKTELQYKLDGQAVQSVPMRWSGGQVFWGELPASAVGNVRYFVTSTDSNGNTGKSEFYSLDTGGGCSGHAQTYCTGLVNSQGCAPSLLFTGAPSASAGSGFILRTSGLVPNTVGIYFYSKTGPASMPFAGGLLCVAPPIKRTAPASFGGTGACSGQLNLDFNAHIAGGTDPGLVTGATVWIQAWARDNAAASKVSTSNALRFTICQ